MSGVQIDSLKILHEPWLKFSPDGFEMFDFVEKREDGSIGMIVCIVAEMENNRDEEVEGEEDG